MVKGFQVISVFAKIMFMFMYSFFFFFLFLRVIGLDKNAQFN